MRLALRQLVLVVGKLEVGPARVQVGLVGVRVRVRLTLTLALTLTLTLTLALALTLALTLTLTLTLALTLTLTLSPSRSLIIAEHSMCQPGRPSPQGEDHAGSPALLRFHSTKSAAWSGGGLGLDVPVASLWLALTRSRTPTL